MLTITYAEMLDQLKKICQYYFFDGDFLEKVMNPIMDKYEYLGNQNIDDYVKQFEDKTDAFIHKIAACVDGNRKKSIQLVNQADEEILFTLMVRLTAFETYCNENPNKEHLMLLGDTNAQLVVDCLINFYRAYSEGKMIIF